MKVPAARIPLLVPLACTVVLVACEAPPEAPQGLNESMRYLIREFYGDDATVGAGMSGLMQWYDDEGHELLALQATEGATLDNSDSFTLGDLSPEDVAHLPLDDDGRDVTEAAGLVSLSVLDCPWVDAERVALRTDMDVVLDDIYETYDRTYHTSRPAYEEAAEAGEYAVIDEPLEVFDGAYRGGKTDASLLRVSDAVSTSRFGVTIYYDLESDFRHGVYDVGGVPTEVAFQGAWLPHAAPGVDGVNVFEQAYSIEAKIPHADGGTLRIYAVWAYLDSPWISPDDAAYIATTVNEARDAATRISDVCSGSVTLPPEDGVGL